MKKLFLSAAFVAISAPAFAACPLGSTCNPLENYFYGRTAATPPYPSSLEIAAIPNNSAGSALTINANLFATLSDTQTLTNKTFTSPTINGGTLSGTIAGNFTLSGHPIFSGLTAGTCASALAIDSGNNVVKVGCAAGSGVTSVTLSSPGGIFAATGTNPIVSTGTFGYSTTGTSGGIPYFSSASQLSSSGVMAQYGTMIGGGAGASPVTVPPNTSGFVLTSNGPAANPTFQAPTGGGGGLSGMTAGQIPVAATASTVTSSKPLTGNGANIATSTGALTSGHVAVFDASSNIIDGGAPSGGLSGMTSGYVPIAATANTITSSKPLTGNGANVASSTGTLTSGHIAAIDASSNIVDGGAPPISGMTAGRVPIAATATTITSSLPTSGTSAVTQIASATSAAKTSGHLATWDANANLVDGGAVPGAGAATQFIGTTAGGPTTYTMAAAGFVANNQFQVCANFSTANTANPTLNVNSTGAKAIMIQSGVGLLTPGGGEITTTSQFCFQLDPTFTFWVLQTVALTGPPIAVTDTVTAAKWASCQSYTISTASQTITLPAAGASTPTGGCITIQTIGVPASLCAVGSDVINNGKPDASTAGGCVFVPADVSTEVDTSGTAGATAYSVPLGPYQYRDQSWAEGLNLSANARFVGRFLTERAIYGIKCNVQASAGAASTIHLFSTASGTAPGSGTPLDTTGCNANTGSNNEQDMGVAGAHILANYTVWAVYSGAGTTGNGGFTITFR